jgi:hypothetical protein
MVGNSRIAFRGNGRSDFIGDGAAIVGNGSSTRLVVNSSRGANRGAPALLYRMSRAAVAPGRGVDPVLDRGLVQEIERVGAGHPAARRFDQADGLGGTLGLHIGADDGGTFPGK